MREMRGLYNIFYNTEILKKRSFLKHHFNMSSIKNVSHELVLKIDSLTVAAFISMQHVLLLVQWVNLFWQNTILHTICGRHIITNLILQSNLNYYPIYLQINRFLVVPRNLCTSENVMDK
jgi:hypothetical protein